MSEQNQRESRKLGSGGCMVAFVLLGGLALLIYGLIGWVIHWYHLNQL